MGFKSPAQIEHEPHAERWRLVRPLIYEGRDDVFVIAQGFATDLASLPSALRWVVPRGGRCTSASILHDALWARLRQSRDDGREPPPFTARSSSAREPGASAPVPR
jgi:hypothetical protein